MLSISLRDPVGWGVSSAAVKKPVKNSRADVEQLQRALKDIGLDNVSLTGTIAGPNDFTVMAIKAFQQHEFGWNDGVVDPGRNTETRINAILSMAVADPPPAPPAPPVDIEVKKHIQWALARHAGMPEYDRLWAAAWDLKNERNKRGGDGKPVNCGNKPLAYAEHYLLARAFVASGHYSLLRMALYALALSAIAWYELPKLANALTTALMKFIKQDDSMVEKIRRKLYGMVYHLGECPPSNKPPDPLSIRWGVAGAADGLLPLKNN